MHHVSHSSPAVTAASARPRSGFMKSATLTLSALTLAGIALLAPPSAHGQGTPAREKTEFPALRLNKHESGEAAVRALGDRLPEVARWYNKSPEEFAANLRRDAHARIDREGRLYYVDQFPEATTTASGGTATIGGALLPLEQTFRLHSRPGAQRIIYLDFNGHLASGTAWNNSWGLSAIDAPAFDLDGNPAAFGTTELQRIQYIWQRVAEDYAPFDVDVTTEEPPADAIARSGVSDPGFGTRVVVTRDWTANTARPCNCGGFAYVGAFDDTSEYYKPAWVFYNRLGSGNEKYVAEAISHEAGHNLGLSHDGTTAGVAYYQGHGSGATGWAPIMGAGYYKELVQWSKGEYPNANNTEDDIARIQMFGAPLRPDDHGDSFGAATPLTATAGAGSVSLSGDGVINGRGDVDVFSFSSGAGSITLNVSPAARSANLDLQAELYDARGALVAAANPAEALNAGISVSNAAAGTYFLKIDGVGKGDLGTGYSDYASVGQYVIGGSTPASSGQPPVAIASATPTSGTASLTVNFSGGNSYDPDGGAVSHSWNFGDGSAASAAANPAHVYQAAGSYTATLSVTDSSGAVAMTQLPITVASPAPRMRVERIGMSLSSKPFGTRATATVVVTDASGAALAGAVVTGAWSGLASKTVSGTTGTGGSVSLTSPAVGTRGTFTFTVTGISLSGYVYDAAQNKQTSASIAF